MLPKNEKKFIEEQAFKANYSKREVSKSNPQNLKFTLSGDAISVKLIKELKREYVVLSINDDKIGVIQDYNPTENTLIIKDTFISIDEIPEKGEIIQDVSQETSQYKKQEEACEQFKIRDIQNPEIASILSTPENIPVSNRVVLDYEAFKEEVKSPYLKNDDSQRDAVLEAINRKPVYLIQGPPGTGKTTVIVEMVQQLIQQNSNVKILITSQSNLAVDNVLERLPKDILFMRLVSDLAVENDNVSQDIKDHLFDTKLQNWVKKTQDNSNQYLAKKFGEKTKNKDLISFYSSYKRLPKTKTPKQFLDAFYGTLRLSPNYIKRLFENVSSKKDIDAIFKKELGVQYLDLLSIQKEWFAFTSNATSDDGKKKKSMLNNGSTEIDLHTAFCKTINVFGATCIHIAGSKYRDINFKFDYVIMDESSKASPAETLVPLTMAKNLILIGDHKQLPPVVTREEAIKAKIKKELDDNGLDFNKEFGTSLFETLIVAFKDNPSLQNCTKMLDIQYRMPRQIGDLISRHFYSDDPNSVLKNPDTRLETLKNYDADKFHHLNLKIPEVTILDRFTKTNVNVPSSILFISTSQQRIPYDNGNLTNRNNPCNVATIQSVLKTLNTQYKSNLKQDKPFNIGIIAGYRGQVNLLKEQINTKSYSNFYSKPNSLIEINTVDKFQGAERDIIIYDIVKSSIGEDTIGFLEDYRRINVAFSRAKRLLIIVGDSEFILKRAKLHPRSDFKEFKLKMIVEELAKQNLVFNSLKEAVND
ncbi:AAA domain-containing protein [Gelidibacter japonicus]|uniref:AAA domain-containing protein n=1 Tax=Gelidibacter japonicus TaxID=1962232 RepID=UPI003A93369B